MKGPELGSDLSDATFPGWPCEGCGCPPHFRPDGGESPVVRWQCRDCEDGHLLCPECWVECRVVAGKLCEVVEGWRMAVELSNPDHACALCAGRGHVSEWACRACGGSHRICHCCMSVNPALTADVCVDAIRTGRGL